MDYLSLLKQNNQDKMTGDCIVLNSISCVQKALPFLKGYGYKKLYTWLDNDEAGKKATDAFSEFATTQEGLLHRPMNKQYAAHKDVNAWHMHTLHLKT